MIVCPLCHSITWVHLFIKFQSWEVSPKPGADSDENPGALAVEILSVELPGASLLRRILGLETLKRVVSVSAAAEAEEDDEYESQAELEPFETYAIS